MRRREPSLVVLLTNSWKVRNTGDSRAERVGAFSNIYVRPLEDFSELSVEGALPKCDSGK